MLSLDVGGGKIKVLTGKCKHNTAVISGYFEVVLENGTSILDEGQPEKYGLLLRDALKERGMRDRKCAVSLRSADLFFRRITLPDARPARVKEMVAHSLNGILAVKDYYVDYMAEQGQAVNGQKRLDVLLCGAPKKLADAYYEMLTVAGLIQHRMDAQQNYIERLLNKNAGINGKSIKDKAVLLLDTGNTLLGANLFVDGKSAFERTIRVQQAGPLDFADELSDMFLPGSIQADDANPLFTKIYNEAQKMMQFSLTRAFKLPVTSVYLYGENASNQYLAQELADSLGVPVEPLSENAGIRLEEGYNGPGVCSIFGCAAALL